MRSSTDVYEAIKVEVTDELKEALREALADMVNSVELELYTSRDCAYCSESLKLLKLLEECSPSRGGRKLISYKVYERGKHDELFRAREVERVPTLSLIEGYIKYVGTPSGEELRGLVETIIRISQGESGLDESTVDTLSRELKDKVKVMVLVTPQCPYCPYASLLANMFAYELWRRGHKKLVAETVEALENSDIADRYGIEAVPAIVVNDVLVFQGGVPYEEDLLTRILEVVQKD